MLVDATMVALQEQNAGLPDLTTHRAMPYSLIEAQH